MATEKTGAIVLAGGQGKRMESDVQKQYMTLCQRPLITYSLEAFERSQVDMVILVTDKGGTAYARETVVDTYGFSKVIDVVEGGKERYHSVYAGLKALKDKGCDYVLIHDGARPLVTTDIIGNAIREVKECKACVIGMPVKDTIKISDGNGFADSTPDRSLLWQIQTPQAFSYELVFRAYDKIMGDPSLQVGITDDAMVVESHGNRKVRLVKGSYENLKVTTPEDLDIAEALLKKRLSSI